MVKRRRSPRRCRVARLACLAEVRGHVIGVRRTGEFRLMALVAARIRQLVIIIHMARCALGGCMLPAQREVRGIVIVRRARPVYRRMA